MNKREVMERILRYLKTDFPDDFETAIDAIVDYEKSMVNNELKFTQEVIGPFRNKMKIPLHDMLLKSQIYRFGDITDSVFDDGIRRLTGRKEDIQAAKFLFSELVKFRRDCWKVVHAASLKVKGEKPSGKFKRIFMFGFFIHTKEKLHKLYSEKEDRLKKEEIESVNIIRKIHIWLIKQEALNVEKEDNS